MENSLFSHKLLHIHPTKNCVTTKVCLYNYYCFIDPKSLYKTSYKLNNKLFLIKQIVIKDKDQIQINLKLKGHFEILKRHTLKLRRKREKKGGNSIDMKLDVVGYVCHLISERISNRFICHHGKQCLITR